MAMTLRLPAELDAQLRAVAAEDHRSVRGAVLHAVETYLARRETDEVMADPSALRSLAEAREAAAEGDLAHGAEAVRRLIASRRDV